MPVGRLLLCAAILLAAAPGYALDVAANLEVTAMSGRTVVFKGYTDEHGRFETTPLPPGVYNFQLRIPKTITTPARYSLALSGARPMGDALVGPGVAVAMSAEVRRVTTVKGQASGRRVILVPATPPATAATNSATNSTTTLAPSNNLAVASNRPPNTASYMAAAPGARTNTAPISNTRTAPTAMSAAAAATPPKPAITYVAGRPPTGTTSASTTPVAGLNSGTTPVVRQSTSAASTTTAGRPIVSSPGAKPGDKTKPPTSVSQQRVVSPGAVSLSPATPQTAPASSQFASNASRAPGPQTSGAPLSRAATYPPKIINGKRYIWVPVAPGSNQGRWVPEATPTQTPASSPARR